VDDLPPETAAPASVRISKTALHWLLEGLLIVVSVVLGFGVAEYGERRQEQQLAARVLRGLSEEIAHNAAQLEPALQKHVAWQDAIEKWFDHNTKTPPPHLAARDAFISTMPGFDPNGDLNSFELPFPTLRSAAWDTAVSTGALRLIDYEVTAALSEIYAWQGALPAIPTDDTAFFDPSQLVPATIRTSFALDALIISEHTLLNLYKKHLPAVRAAAGDAN
jgi:hypothetical protein